MLKFRIPVNFLTSGYYPQDKGQGRNKMSWDKKLEKLGVVWDWEHVRVRESDGTMWEKYSNAR